MTRIRVVTTSVEDDQPFAFLADDEVELHVEMDDRGWIIDTERPRFASREEPTDEEVEAVLAKLTERGLTPYCWLCGGTMHEGQSRRTSNRGPLHSVCLGKALAEAGT